jgi:hypothetical protein
VRGGQVLVTQEPFASQTSHLGELGSQHVSPHGVWPGRGTHLPPSQVSHALQSRHVPVVKSSQTWHELQHPSPQGCATGLGAHWPPSQVSHALQGRHLSWSQTWHESQHTPLQGEVDTACRVAGAETEATETRH